MARTLSLDVASQRHMLALAGHLPPTPSETEHDAVAERAQALLDSWATSPAVLVDGRFDITAWNAAYAGRLVRPSADPGIPPQPEVVRSG
ncbi:MmyB family transcriptional regulator [Frankia sp. AgKG'84/4]|uniref:MmyB family transcriptional regulator n=1 Tax=Frankia sp. AgKG'84/4 TaxID=573490 RepID=UPI00200C0862|nr:hypothetical protein [Frankia sp. AgKG'84/4]MCL9794200.1 hypothetical protein [Frankia sp. AgKG'84/4]